MSDPAIESAGLHLATSPAAVASERAGETEPDKPHCSTCHLRDVCLPRGLDDRELRRLDTLKFTPRKLKAGRTLYREGDEFRHFYAVRAGTLKSSLMLADGREQVLGFHIMGELVGFDGLAAGLHAGTTIALEDTETCAIPYALLAEPAAGSASLQRFIGQLMSREILREHSQMLLLGGSMTAEERLAAFLLDLSERYAARGYSAREFHLRMSRAEIGSYLGIKLETVSRTFSAFQQQGLLQIDWRRVRIADLDGLKRRFDARVPAT